MNMIFKKISAFFKNIFHTHNYVLMCSKEIVDVYEWEECYRVTASDAFSEGRSYYRDKKYEGPATLAWFHCKECGNNHLELQYPGGLINYTNNYLISLLHKHFTKDELNTIVNEINHE